MEELLVIVLQVLFEFFGEAIVQGLAEGICELVGYFFDNTEIRVGHSWVVLAGYMLLGAFAGIISAVVVPHVFIHIPVLRIVGVLTIPFLMGAIFTKIGDWRERRGQMRSRLDNFTCSYAFALTMALVRFWLVG